MMLVLLLDGERQVRYEISAMMQIIGKNNRKNIKELQKIKKEHLFGAKIHGIIELVDKIKCFVHSLKRNIYMII